MNQEKRKRGFTRAERFIAEAMRALYVEVQQTSFDVVAGEARLASYVTLWTWRPVFMRDDVVTA